MRHSRPRSRRLPASLALGAFLVGGVVVGALVSWVYLPHDPTAIQVARRLAPPQWGYWLGTDQYGRDLLSRLLVGARTALGVGVVSVSIGLVSGALLGTAAAWSRGWLDEVLTRLVDVLSAFPGLLLAVLVAAIIGPGTTSSMLAIGISSIPGFARLTRASVLSLRASPMVEAAVAAGATPWRIVRCHLWPNVLSLLTVQATLAFAGALLAEAALSYLGLGTQPPTPSWGRMLREAQSFVALSPYPALFPGLAIALAVLGLNLLGDGLRDWLDPKLAHSGRDVRYSGLRSTSSTTSSTPGKSPRP